MTICIVPDLEVPSVLQLVPDLRRIPRVPRLGACIYFLCNGDEVVYVGQSINLAGRISAHEFAAEEGHKNSRTFDRIYAVACSEEHDLNSAEGAFIRRLQPRQQGRHLNGKCVAPSARLTHLDDEILRLYRLI